jgi:hypothetical protein
VADFERYTSVARDYEARIEELKATFQQLED